MEQHSRDVSSGSSYFLGASWFDPTPTWRSEIGFVGSSRSSWMQSWTRCLVARATAGACRLDNGVRGTGRVSACTPGPPVARFVGGR